jgi:hypothetical protein
MTTPALPPGFVLQPHDDTPPLPPGFVHAPDFSQVTATVSGPASHKAAPDHPLRGLAMGARNLAEGAAGTIDFFGGPVYYALEKLTGEHQTRYGDLVRKGADAIGAPEARDPFERTVAAVNRGLAGTALTMGAGTAAAPLEGAAGQAGRFLAANPVLQTAGAVNGSAAGEVVRENGGGTGAQIAASLGGGLSPAVLAPQPQQAVPQSGRGGEHGRRMLEAAIADFRAAGTTPTVGQGTQSPVWRGVESLLAKLPGSSGIIERKAAQQGQEIGAGVNRLAQTLSPRIDATRAGQSIERGIRGPGGFIESTRATEAGLYDKLDNFIPGITRVPVGNAAAALDSVNATIPGAPAMSPMFQNSRLMALQRSFLSDATPAAGGLPGRSVLNLPFEAVKKTRTMVGNEIDNASLVSDVPRSKWKALYGGLSQDMGDAARAAGPQAEGAFKRASGYTRARAGRLEAIDHVLGANGGPEAIFNAAISGTKEGATTLRAVLRSLPEQGQKDVAAAVLQRMGRATSGNQNAAGDVFSSATFLTNWDRLSKPAQAALFDRFGPEFRSKVEAITRVASNLRDGSKVFSNPSGSASTGAQIGGYTALGASGLHALTGNPLPFLGVAGGMGVANRLAATTTNPRFVNWLALQTPVPVGASAGQSGALGQVKDPPKKRAK